MTLAVGADRAARRRARRPVGDPAGRRPGHDGAGPSPRRGADPARRVGALRAAALRSAAIPGVAIVYALSTLDGPRRPAMILLAGILVLVAAMLWLAAEGITRSKARVPLSIANLAVHIGGVAYLSYLDGGVATPLGTVIFFSLPFFAVTVPPALFRGIALATVVAYWTVALTGAPAPAGYALVHTFGFLGVSGLCAAHARLLRSLRRRLTLVSQQDPLTGCLNRRGFDKRLGQELSRAERSGRPVTLVLVDLDAFKAVNDSFGHHVGDDLLRWVGTTLREAGRASDAVGRLGGDEFAVIVTDTGPDDASPVIERLSGFLDHRCPASMGHASYPADADDVEHLARIADERLYVHKATRALRSPHTPTTATPAPFPGGGASATTPDPTDAEKPGRDRSETVAVASMTLTNFVIGFFYSALFVGPSGHRSLLLLLTAAGVVLSVATFVGAGVLSRLRISNSAVLTHIVASYALGLSATVLDGGVRSPIALGLLTPLPLLALGFPIRRALPAFGIAAASYLAIGMTVGRPGGWYLAIHLIGILSISIGCALQRRVAAEQRRLLGQLSRLDSLTGSLNRRGFEERFDAELAHAERHDDALSLLLLDVDAFKQLNDSRGHAAGDDLLCWINATLADLLRAHDVTGRLGGDEFVAVLTDCPADQAAVIADRVRAILAPRLSCSIGTATLSDDGADFDALYRHADAALYAEKAGRRP